MKLQKIKQVCDGIYVLFNCPDGQQWIGDGSAAYPVEGIVLSKDAIPAVFDILRKKLEETVIQETDVEDERFRIVPAAEEEPLNDQGDVLYLGNVYRALLGRDGLLCIPRETLKPVEGKDDGLRFFARRSDRAGGTPLIAVYTDLLCGALIMPMATKGVENIQEDMRRKLDFPAWPIGQRVQPQEPLQQQTEMEGGESA